MPPVKECPDCNGAGFDIEICDLNYEHETDCARCKGTGEVPIDPVK